MTIPITDTHQHLVNGERWPYDWAHGYLPNDGERFRYDDYVAVAADTGITRTIFMETGLEPPHYSEETAATLALAAAPDSLLAGVIANCRPEADEATFVAEIEAIQDDHLVGLRRILHVMPDDTSANACFRANVGRLGALGLTFDLCFASSQLAAAYCLAAACPNTTLVLDHCGVPDIADEAFDGWRDDVNRLAELPHLNCKISGVVAYCAADDVSADAVRPYVEHCIEAFGWDRVVWGGDWPVCCTTSSLAEWVTISRALVAAEDPSHQAALFHENAERIYGLST
jgi:predicted TIM-barrel fold metal-dependent hydrolase